jgi:hypothetical protein
VSGLLACYALGSARAARLSASERECRELYIRCEWFSSEEPFKASGF